MLHQDKPVGRRSVVARLLGFLRIGVRRPADLDLIAMKPHLLRDIGLDNGLADIRRRAD